MIYTLTLSDQDKEDFLSTLSENINENNILEKIEAHEKKERISPDIYTKQESEYLYYYPNLSDDDTQDFNAKMNRGKL